MILIALGANLPGPGQATPRETLEAALTALAARGVRVLARSPWYSTPPWPPSDQPRYVNGVAAVASDLAPADLLATLHAVERGFGRVRGARNAARSLDLDLIDHDGRVSAADPVLPHPRMDARAFVLRPLKDVAPDWRHPVTGESVEALLARAPDRDDILPLGGEEPAPQNRG